MVQGLGYTFTKHYVIFYSHPLSLPTFSNKICRRKMILYNEKSVTFRLVPDIQLIPIHTLTLIPYLGLSTSVCQTENQLVVSLRQGQEYVLELIEYRELAFHIKIILYFFLLHTYVLLYCLFFALTNGIRKDSLIRLSNESKKTCEK